MPCMYMYMYTHCSHNHSHDDYYDTIHVTLQYDGRYDITAHAYPLWRRMLLILIPIIATAGMTCFHVLLFLIRYRVSFGSDFSQLNKEIDVAWCIHECYFHLKLYRAHWCLSSLKTVIHQMCTSTVASISYCLIIH
jgi:hypothetical protein